MSLKARLRIAIIVLVTLVVVAMASLYLYDFTHLAFGNASARASLIIDEVRGNLNDRLGQSASSHPLKESWTRIIQDDPSISRMLRRMLANTELVSSIFITDDGGIVLTASDPGLIGKSSPEARDFRRIQDRYWFTNLSQLLTKSENYGMTVRVGVPGNVQFGIALIIKSDLLKHAVEPGLSNLTLAFGASLLIAIFLGSVVPNIVLDPLGRMSQRIDAILSGRFEAAEVPQRETREFADVQSKLNLLGEQFRGAKKDALDLRSNVEQLLQRLEETVLLFDNNGRLLMAGESAGRMLGKQHSDLMGRGIDELFPASGVLGGIISNAVRAREPVKDQTVTIPRDGASSAKLLVSVQMLRKSAGHEEIGTLVTIRDVESRKQLERQLDLSSRLAALSRLTSGVAHEIKNPLNAMALHLEVLRGRLDGQEPELDVIAREIKRLDTVVKTFLNFNKPMEVQSKPLDLSFLVGQIVALVSPEAHSKGIQIESVLREGLWINGDADLLKQAILNVINNGLEAMRQGGKLTVHTATDGEECELAITDAGAGIAPEIQDRIFNLYFTTKESGTGIGLATTFRVVQLHSGTIDFVSERGKGTTFRLRFPGMVDYRGEVVRSATGSS